MFWNGLEPSSISLRNGTRSSTLNSFWWTGVWPWPETSNLVRLMNRNTIIPLLLSLDRSWDSGTSIVCCKGSLGVPSPLTRFLKKTLDKLKDSATYLVPFRGVSLRIAFIILTLEFFEVLCGSKRTAVPVVTPKWLSLNLIDSSSTASTLLKNIHTSKFRGLSTYCGASRDWFCLSLAPSPDWRCVSPASSYNLILSSLSRIRLSASILEQQSFFQDAD